MGLLLYKDIFTEDEMFSSAFTPEEKYGGIVYEVNCAMEQRGKGVQVNIGANASAEGEEEQMDDGVETVNNIIANFGLAATSFNLKSYGLYLKGYLKAVKAHLVEEGASSTDIDAFMEGATAFFSKTVKPNFKDYEFYTGSSMGAEGMVALLNYREDGTTPYFTFWKAGLKVEKL